MASDNFEIYVPRVCEEKIIVEESDHLFSWLFVKTQYNLCICLLDMLLWHTILFTIDPHQNNSPSGWMKSNDFFFGKTDVCVSLCLDQIYTARFYDIFDKWTYTK